MSDTRYGFYQVLVLQRFPEPYLCVNHACNLSMPQLLHTWLHFYLKNVLFFLPVCLADAIIIVSCSMATFRDKSINKWQRMTQVTTGAAAIKGKLHAFNQVKFCDWTVNFYYVYVTSLLFYSWFVVLQDISHQVASYMRDPSRMIKQMQLRKSAIKIFGSVSQF